jgi:uncharacterized protein
VTEILFAGFALMLVAEGVLPFVSPRILREAYRGLMELSDGQLRFAGLTLMLAGLLILFVVL